VRGPVLGTGVLVLVVVHRWHDGGYHLAFEAGEAPGFCSQLHDALHRYLYTFLLFGVSKMLDCINNFFYDSTGGRVNALLRAAARKCREQRLLAPDGLFASTFVSDMVTHREE
jgi:hypothetical protein